MWYPEIEVSIGRSLKKAKGEKEKEKKKKKKENKYFLAFRRKAKKTFERFVSYLQNALHTF